MPGQLTTRILRNPDELRSIAGEWSNLWQECHGATPFQRCQWLLPWIEVFSPHKLRVIAVWRGEARPAQQLVALAPLLIYPRGSARVLALAGGGVSDYLDALVHPAYLEHALSAIFHCIDELADEWDVAEFTDLTPSSPLLRMHGYVVHSPHDACPVLSIPAGVSQLSDFIPARQLRNLRNARNRIAQLTDVCIERASAATAGEFLDALFQLHSARWNSAGMPGVLCGDRLRDFHLRVVHGLLPGNIVRLYGLRCAGHLIGVLYAIFERSTAYYYLQGFDPEFAWYSPGTQLIARVVEDALREGKKQVDFLRGREPYKYSWGPHDNLTSRLTYAGVRPTSSMPKSAA
jgi:CelD/BcsL family acetyltransferase involved in cellulose biosynthesis